MKTLFISHVGTPGGAEYATLSVCRGTPGSEVLLLSEGPLQDMVQAQGVPCTVLPLSAGVTGVKRSSGVWASIKAVPGVVGFLRRLARCLRDYDVIVPVSQKAFVLVMLARAFVRRPVIWYMNDLISADHFSRHLTRVMVFLANRGASAVIVNSAASRDSWLAAGGRDDTCSVSYSGIDGTHIASLSASKVAEYRAQFAADGKFVGVVVGRIAGWKGQHVVLEALRELPDVRVVFVGEAMFDEAGYEQRLKNYVAAHQLGDRVLFLGHRDDVAEIMAAADAVVHSSTAAEPFGRVIVEGMMVGRPVIASDAGGPREIIEHERSGLLSPPGDAAGLAKAIRRLASDPALAAGLAAAGQARAHALFDVRVMVDHFLAVRNGVLPESRGDIHEPRSPVGRPLGDGKECPESNG